MSLELTLSDGSALPSPLTFTANRGASSTETYHLKLFNPDGVTAPSPFLVLKELISLVYQDKGTPVTDERWGRVQITSLDQSGTAGQDPGLGIAQVVGSFTPAFFPDLLAGNAIFFDLYLYQPSSSSSDGAVSIGLYIPEPQTAWPVPLGVSSVATGIETLVNRACRPFAISGLRLTASGSPDGNVHVSAAGPGGSWNDNGTERTDSSARTQALSQNDGASVALGAGESYWAGITRGSSTTTVNVTKGLKGTSPVKPVLPYETLCGWVQVNYGVSGSVIHTADISGDPAYGRLFAEATTGLGIRVYEGFSLIDGMYQTHRTEDLVLTDNATNEIWMGRDGLLAQTTSTTPPSVCALHLWTFTTVSGAITGDTDPRTDIANWSTPAHGASHGVLGRRPRHDRREPGHGADDGSGAESSARVAGFFGQSYGAHTNGRRQLDEARDDGVRGRGCRHRDAESLHRCLCR